MQAAGDYICCIVHLTCYVSVAGCIGGESQELKLRDLEALRQIDGPVVQPPVLHQVVRVGIWEGKHTVKWHCGNLLLVLADTLPHGYYESVWTKCIFALTFSLSFYDYNCLLFLLLLLLL